LQLRADLRLCVADDAADGAADLAVAGALHRAHP